MQDHRTKSELELEIERRWREKLLRVATAEEFQQAYDELHALFLKEQECPGQIYAQVNPRGMDRARRLILRKVGQGQRVLEVGSGDGETSRLLARQGNAVVSIDISRVALETARKRVAGEGLDLRYEYGDARALNFASDTFDYVVSEHFVEHLSPSDLLVHLTEVQRVLRKGGCYLISTPSRLWNGRRSVGFHLRVYTLEELCQVVEQAGFAVTWLEPRFLRRLGFVIALKKPLLWPVFLWERLLDAIRIYKWPPGIRSRLIPSVIVCASKRN